MDALISTRSASIPFSLPTSKKFKIAFLLLLLASIGLQALSIYVYTMGFDEGVHLLIAKLMAAGYQPYTEIFVGYPPMFVLILKLVTAAGSSILTGKVIFIALNSVLLLVLGGLGRRLLGEAATLLGLLVVIVSPVYVSWAGAIMADMPAVLFGCGSVWLTLFYLKHKHWSLILLAGVAAGLSLLTKLLMPFVIPLVFIILLLDHRSQRPNSTKSIAWIPLRSTGLFLSGILAIILLFLPFFDVSQIYESAFLFRMTVRAAYPFSWTEQLGQFQLFFAENSPLLIGLFLGLAYLTKLANPIRIILLAWLAMAALWLLIQVPLRPQHLITLLPPMALLAGWGYWRFNLTLTMRLYGVKRQPERLLRLPIILVLVLTGGYGLIWHSAHLIMREDYLSKGQIPKRYTWMSERNETIKQIGFRTAPNDCVISDDPVLLLDMDRLPPPELVEPSIARIIAGDLSAQSIIDLAERYGCQAAVVTNERFDRLPVLQDWFAQNYLFTFPVHPGAKERTVESYQIKKDTVQPPAKPLGAAFENGVSLVGVDTETTILKPGQLSFVSFYWRLNQPVNTPYKLFIHVRPEDGSTVFQLDRFSFNNEIPLAQWPLNSTIKDTNWFELPATLAPGTYQFVVGLYHPDTGQRLAIEEDISGENAVVVAEVTVQ